MRKIKKQLDVSEEVIKLLNETLEEYYIPFSLMAKSEKEEIKEFYDKVLSKAIKISKIKNGTQEKRNELIQLRFDVVSFISFYSAKYIKNKNSLNNFVLLLIIYETIKFFSAGEKKDYFKEEIKDNPRLLKSINSLININNIHLEKTIDVNDLIYPEDIIKDLEKVKKNLSNMLFKHLRYLSPFINDNQLEKDLINKITYQCQLLKKDLDFDHYDKTIREDFIIYIAIKSRLNSLKFDLDSYSGSGVVEEEIKKDIKYLKTNLTNLNKSLSNYEKLVLEGEY